jgi:hypothetical protein
VGNELEHRIRRAPPSRRHPRPYMHHHHTTASECRLQVARRATYAFRDDAFLEILNTCRVASQTTFFLPTSLLSCNAVEPALQLIVGLSAQVLASKPPIYLVRRTVTASTCKVGST